MVVPIIEFGHAGMMITLTPCSTDSLRHPVVINSLATEDGIPTIEFDCD